MDEEIKIEQMTQADVEKVIEIGETTPEFNTGTDAPQFYTRETLIGWVNDANGVTFVARANNELVGFIIGYYMSGPNDTYINCMAVVEKFRRKGIASRLLRTALKKCEEKCQRGMNHVFGVVKTNNQATLNFLKKEGFEIGETFHYIEVMNPKITL